MAILAALLLGRAASFDRSGPQDRDRAEMPDADRGTGFIEGENDLALPERASVPVAPDVKAIFSAQESNDAPRGRLYVSDIFRPPMGPLA
jgi:hypothetical protein